MKFPVVTASNLSGREFTLPRDLDGQVNLVTLCYYQEQQYQVDSWTQPLLALTRQYPAFRFYELPTLPRYNVMQRRMIDFGMRTGIGVKEVLDRTITLYLDVAAFNAAVGVPTPGAIWSLLIDREGSILWRAAGPYTREAGESLARKLAEIFPQRATPVII